jgi:hypothetical protein
MDYVERNSPNRATTCNLYFKMFRTSMVTVAAYHEFISILLQMHKLYNFLSMFYSAHLSKSYTCPYGTPFLY